MKALILRFGRMFAPAPNVPQVFTDFLQQHESVMEAVADPPRMFGAGVMQSAVNAPQR
jgi:hypothetical protein